MTLFFGVFQTLMKTTVRNVIIPLVNLRLQTGFPIPVLPGVVLTEAEITYADHYLLICTNVEYTGGIFSRVGLATSHETNGIVVSS